MSQVGIETSQHVHINYQIANVGDRIFAYIIDAVFIAIYGFAVFAIWGSLNSSSDPDQLINTFWVPYLFIAVPAFIYKVVLEIIWGGYTIGKWLVGIRVVKIDGSRAGISNYLLRWLFSIFEITMTQGLVAMAAILINGKGQRLGDIVGRTCVIKKKKKVKLEDTLFSELDSEYEITFHRIHQLSDQDIRIIKEVINSKKEYDSSTWFVMLQRTRKLIEGKIGESEEKVDALVYLETVIKDYNAYHGLRN